MKFVKLEQTAMIGGLPRSPAEGEQLVTNAQADHMVDMGQVKRENVKDAPGFSHPDDRDGDESEIDEKSETFKKAVEAAVKKAKDKAFDKAVSTEVDKQVAARNQADFDKAVADEVEKQVDARDQADFEKAVADEVEKRTRQAG